MNVGVNTEDDKRMLLLLVGTKAKRCSLHCNQRENTALDDIRITYGHVAGVIVSDFCF